MATVLLNVYDNAGRRCRTLEMDARYDAVREVRRLLSNLEFELMEPEPCPECLDGTGAAIVKHMIAAFMKGDDNV